jgi:type II secretory pathway predicted ATPase ExeA
VESGHSALYGAFFGLQDRPFDLVPNPRFLFLTPGHREALSNLGYGLTTPRGLTLLTGEAGTGKTTLIHAILGELDSDRIQTVVVSNPTLTRAEFYESLATGFGLSVEARLSKTQFLSELRRHLEARSAADQLTALIIDEAQSLPYELLEEVRLLSNIETSTTKLLNVILAGQPELSERLNDTSLRQLKQRISLRCELALFDFMETAAYIAGRLRIAGGDPARIFSREAILAIHEASRGVPRTVNVICDNALIGAFAAQTRPVLRSLVENVCRDFDLRRSDGNAPERPAAHATGPAGELNRPEPRAAESHSLAASNPGPDAPVADDRRLSGTRSLKKRFSFF